METEGEVVGGGGLRGVKVADLVVAAAHEVVVADYDAGNRGEEDGVGGEVGCEIVGCGEEVPRGFVRDIGSLGNWGKEECLRRG